MKMKSAIIKKRLMAVRCQLTKRKIDCLVLTKPSNVTYATGFSGEDSWAVIAKGRVYLLTDSRYTEQAHGECFNCTIIQRTAPLPQALGKLVNPVRNKISNRVKKLKSIRTVTVEKSASIEDFEQIKKAVKSRLKSVAGIIETLRSTKDIAEIAAIKTAASIAAKALKQILPHIKPGITENELAGLLDFQIRKLGATNSFETIVAFGPNASRPHHKPTTKKLKRKDTILIDFGAKYKGYCCDITRCFALGTPTTLYKKAYDVVQQAQAAAIKTVKAGVNMVQVDSAAREVIRKSGLPVYGHGTGHGLGLEIHELPFLKPENKGKLKAGQILTIEPAIYITGKLGVRIEDDILVTQTGCHILTRNCPHLPSLP
jgi:Xaa-Pro aminopeptidase